MFYYDEQGNIFKSKIDAIKVPQTCYFYYYDKEFLAANWKLEPNESLDELYKQRAQQLRDKYDRIVIAYSGGADSTCVLESFYYNNIHIDEILVVGAFSQDSNFGSDENHNGEIYLNVKPTLNNLNLPNTKITYCDYSLFLGDPNNFSLIKDCGTEYYKEIGSFFSIHNLFWRDIYKYIEKTNKSTAIVFGEDKPNILPEGDGFCAFFRDMSFNEYGNFQQKDNYKKESFFITPDFPQLTIKQHHILMRLYEYMVKEHKVLPYDKNELTIEKSILENKYIMEFLFSIKLIICHIHMPNPMFYQEIPCGESILVILLYVHPWPIRIRSPMSHLYHIHV